MDLAGCTTEVVICNDTGSNVGEDLILVGTSVVVLLVAVLILLLLLVRRHRRRRRHRRGRRPPARRVWVSADGDLVDGPP